MSTTASPRTAIATLLAVKKRLGTFFCDVYWNATYNRVQLKKVDWALCSATYNQMQLTIVKVYGINLETN